MTTLTEKPRADKPSVTHTRWPAMVLERWAVVWIWLLMIAFFWALRPDVFGTAITFRTIFSSQSAIIFLGVAVLCTVVVGEFVDLSVASILGAAATLVPVLHVQHGVGLVLSCLLAVVAGVIIGVINGLLVVHLGVNTIVVTLGISTAVGGLTLWIADMNTVSGLGTDLAPLVNTLVLGLPLSFYYGIVLVLLTAYLLGFTTLGRHMRFTGASREVSRLAGVPVDRIRFGAFVAAGAISAIGGVLVVAGIGSFDPNASASYLMPTYAAVFLGAAVVQPGRFNPIGIFIATYFLQTGVVGLQTLGLQTWVSDVFYGAGLVVAVTIATILARRRR